VTDLHVVRKVVTSAVRTVRRQDVASLDDAWRALGLDSLDFLEVLVDVEQELGVSVPDRVAARLATPTELIAYLTEEQTSPNPR
jgi:acyl carrier protein